MTGRKTEWFTRNFPAPRRVDRGDVFCNAEDIKTNQKPLLIQEKKQPLPNRFDTAKYVHFFRAKNADTEAKRCIFGGSNQQK